jgi:CheY-like chemotaxis protein
MPDGGTIRLVAENRPVGDEDPLPLAQGDYVVLSVIDSGSGIPPEMIDKVLEPFFTTKEVGKGTGLGLSMVYGFAKQSAGTLRLKSEVGKGTCAELWLPRAPEGASGAARPEAEEKPEPLRPLRILLIDDHAEVRGTTAAMLTELGHSTVEAASGPEAMEKLKTTDEPFDLLVTDYAMPLQSGSEVVRLAREQHPSLPAIIITGYADETAIGRRPAKVGLLMKPFTPGDLSKSIATALSTASSGD